MSNQSNSSVMSYNENIHQWFVSYIKYDIKLRVYSSTWAKKNVSIYGKLSRDVALLMILQNV